ncbi:MAG: septum formation initiator family protein [Candidatus Omnitrophota bacterium]
MSKKKFILLGIFVALIIFLPGYSKLQELKEKNKFLLKEIDSLKNDNKDLSQEIEKLENDPFYIEKKARDRMGIGKKGEIRYKVINDSEETNE